MHASVLTVPVVAAAATCRVPSALMGHESDRAAREHTLPPVVDGGPRPGRPHPVDSGAWTRNRPRRRLAILTEGHFNEHDGKTARGVIRYGRDVIAAVIDSTRAPGNVRDDMGPGYDIPIVATLDEALPRHPDTLLIGIAPTGGRLPDAWRVAILHAIDQGLDVFSGLHTMLGDDAEFAAAARVRGVRIVDFRRPPDRTTTAEGRRHLPGKKVILTAELARRAKHLTTTARVAHRWNFVHDEVGYNYRLPNLNAALGCAQLEQLPSMIERKRALASRYAQAFADVPGVRFLREPPGTASNYWLNAIVLDANAHGARDAVLAILNDAGYMSRPIWTLMHKLPMYSGCPRIDRRRPAIGSGCHQPAEQRPPRRRGREWLRRFASSPAAARSTASCAG